ncbi:MAG TPA: hypothetical protein VGH58_11730 [Solirubrobacterales bacterium]|jgi:hypothetical protein
MRKWLALVGALVVVCVGQADAAGYTEPEEVRAVSWGLNSVDGPHKLTLGISTGYCVGKPKPRLDRITKTWRRKSVVITVFLRFPEVHFGKNEGCGDVGLGMSKQIKFGRSIRHRAIYDGSTSPPQRRMLHR